MTSSLAMMQTTYHHSMAPSTNIDLISHNQPIAQQMQLQNSAPDPNEPNSEMLLALIARNKTLEGESKRFVGFFFHLKNFAVGKS
jgi:hypothetical protein